jgi:hypothetical protein
MLFLSGGPGLMLQRKGHNLDCQAKVFSAVRSVEFAPTVSGLTPSLTGQSVLVLTTQLQRERNNPKWPRHLCATECGPASRGTPRMRSRRCSGSPLCFPAERLEPIAQRPTARTDGPSVIDTKSAQVAQFKALKQALPFHQPMLIRKREKGRVSARGVE